MLYRIVLLFESPVILTVEAQHWIHLHCDSVGFSIVAEYEEDAESFLGTGAQMYYRNLFY